MQETLAATPGMTVEIERIVAHQRGTFMPYFWVRGTYQVIQNLSCGLGIRGIQKGVSEVSYPYNCR